MKDMVVLAGGNSKRGRLLRDKLVAEQYCANFCESFSDFFSAVDQNKIAAILLLFPDEFGIVNQLFEKSTTTPNIVGEAPVVIISTSATENNTARSLHY
jgi:hypothetical protein